MSVHNGFTIEIYTYIVYIPFSHVPLMVPSISRRRTQRIEEDSRLENKSRDIEDG